MDKLAELENRIAILERDKIDLRRDVVGTSTVFVTNVDEKQITLSAASTSSGGAETGSELLDGKNDPGTYFEVVVSAPWVTADSAIIVGVHSLDSDDYNTAEHQVIANYIGFSVGDIVPGVSFTIYAVSDLILNGNVNIFWIGS